MKRTPEQARQTRESLLRAALEVFDRRGVARASLTEIAHEAGVTRGALYWHFKSREELFDALFQRLFSEYSQQLERDIRSGAPDMLGTLRQALLRHFERVERDETICKFLRIV
ncbi:MAG: TetR family transcriptional regulator, partial [Ottowia sp.]|nr:TetR family transcriptional regulator [Ottowia sp.]